MLLNKDSLSIIQKSALNYFETTSENLFNQAVKAGEQFRRKNFTNIETPTLISNETYTAQRDSTTMNLLEIGITETGKKIKISHTEWSCVVPLKNEDGEVVGIFFNFYPDNHEWNYNSMYENRHTGFLNYSKLTPEKVKELLKKDHLTFSDLQQNNLAQKVTTSDGGYQYIVATSNIDKNGRFLISNDTTTQDGSKITEVATLQINSNGVIDIVTNWSKTNITTQRDTSLYNSIVNEKLFHVVREDRNNKGGIRVLTSNGEYYISCTEENSTVMSLEQINNKFFLAHICESGKMKLKIFDLENKKFIELNLGIDYFHINPEIRFDKDNFYIQISSPFLKTRELTIPFQNITNHTNAISVDLNIDSDERNMMNKYDISTTVVETETGKSFYYLFKRKDSNKPKSIIMNQHNSNRYKEVLNYNPGLIKLLDDGNDYAVICTSGSGNLSYQRYETVTRLGIIKEIESVISHILSTYKNTKTILWGRSTGGMHALSIMARGNVECDVIVAGLPNVAPEIVKSVTEYGDPNNPQVYAEMQQYSPNLVFPKKDRTKHTLVVIPYSINDNIVKNQELFIKKLVSKFTVISNIVKFALIQYNFKDHFGTHMKTQNEFWDFLIKIASA